ncbi:MAG: hypothetical protein WBM56_07025 [Robiginitalea sp.]|uniref:hypothetical protein n=1 Tax=Robiginitalea sp. TaxID=1902411 RepID=UPI003C78B965
MHRSVRRLFTAVFLLALFLGSKGIELHALSHAQDNDQITCEWCDCALVLQSTPIEPATVFQLALVSNAPAQNKTLPCYLSKLQDGVSWGPLFGRPPPAV